MYLLHGLFRVESRHKIDPRSGHVGCVVDRVALRQVFFEYFGFPCQSSFHQLLHNHHRSSRAGTIGQQWPTYQEKKKKKKKKKRKKKRERSQNDYARWKRSDMRRSCHTQFRGSVWKFSWRK
jgi:hypothetical protein